MSGLVRFYDTFFYDLGRGMHAFQSDSYKLALLSDAYNPCTSYGTRSGLLSYAQGDVIFESAYNCFFVASSGGVSSLGAPTFDTLPGATTVDGAVIWVSVGLAPPSAHAAFADVSSHEVAGSGYSAGGQSAPVTNTISGRRAVLGVQQVVWIGSVTAKYAVLYKVGTVNGVVNPLVGYVLLDSTGVSLSDSSGTFLVRFGNDIMYALGGW